MFLNHEMLYPVPKLIVICDQSSVFCLICASLIVVILVTIEKITTLIWNLTMRQSHCLAEVITEFQSASNNLFEAPTCYRLSWI